MRRGLATRAASIAVLLGAWEVVSLAIGSRALPPVEAVAAALTSEIAHGDLLRHLGITLWRVALAFAVAMGCGTALGLAMGRWRPLDILFDGWVVLLLNQPALVIAVLAYFFDSCDIFEDPVASVEAS